MKFVLILFVLCIDLIMGVPLYQGAFWNNPVQFCGPVLSAEMSIICKGRYNHDTRSQSTTVSPKTKRAIVDECCLATCTRKYLHFHYCGPETVLFYPTASQLHDSVYVNYHSYYLDLIWTVIKSPQPED